jgi:hypothetical protein
MVFRKRIDVCSRKHMKQINTLRGKMQNVLNAKAIANIVSIMMKWLKKLATIFGIATAISSKTFIGIVFYLKKK